MTEDELREYIPTYGDRVAALTFARTCTGKEENLRKETVLESLRKKLDCKRGKKCHKNLLGNTNAKREMRRIELGWLDFDNKIGDFRQVRTQSGGGTRSLNIPVSASQEDVIEVGKNLFFPDGRSKKGLVGNFDFVLKDFQANNVKEDTIEDMYTACRLKMLRVYLCSRSKYLKLSPNSSAPSFRCEVSGQTDCSNITVADEVMTTSYSVTGVPAVSNISVTDTLTSSNSVTWIPTVSNISVTDTLTSSNSVTWIPTVSNISVTDTLTSSNSVTWIPTVSNISVTDTLTSSNSVTWIPTVSNIAVTDTLTTRNSVTGIPTVSNIAVTDTLTTSNSVTGMPNVTHIEVPDTLASNNSVTGTPNVSNFAVTDTLTTSNSVTRIPNVSNIAVTDMLTTSTVTFGSDVIGEVEATTRPSTVDLMTPLNKSPEVTGVVEDASTSVNIHL